jgi:hypothetical protein
MIQDDTVDIIEIQESSCAQFVVRKLSSMEGLPDPTFCGAQVGRCFPYRCQPQNQRLASSGSTARSSIQAEMRSQS